MKSPANTSGYYPNLHGLRCIAALSVVAVHTEQQRWLLGLPSSYGLAGVAGLGQCGVLLFFVLSGYLITALLLDERRRLQQIDVRAFYLRRILRIWPLYYLALVLGFVILPHFNNQAGVVPMAQILRAHGGTVALLYVFFAANLAFVLYHSIPFLGVLWSIGTEEQFYLVWPWILRLGVPRCLRALLAIPILCVAVRVALIALTGDGKTSSEFTPVLLAARDFMSHYFLIDCMAFGGLAALLLHVYPGAMRAVFTKRVQLMTLLALGACLAIGVQSPVWNSELYGPLFAIVVVNAAANPRVIFSLEAPVMRFLGEISYGIYIYQFVGIDVAHVAMDHWPLMRSPTVGNVLMWLCAFAATVAIAASSYYGFERHFLRLKSRIPPRQSRSAAVALN